MRGRKPEKFTLRRKKAQNQAIFSLFGRIRRHFENEKQVMLT